MRSETLSSLKFWAMSQIGATWRSVDPKTKFWKTRRATKQEVAECRALFSAMRQKSPPPSS